MVQLQCPTCEATLATALDAVVLRCRDCRIEVALDEEYHALTAAA